MSKPIRKAMVLAAGLGQRMRPLTLTTPKPLIAVGGRPLIDYAMDALRAEQVSEAVVNIHYLAGQIEDWARQVKTPRIILSDERDAVLETGGGIARALPHFGAAPFYVLNSDSFWLEHGPPALHRLCEAWDDTAMDCLLLLAPPSRMTGHDGGSDFDRAPDGRLRRASKGSGNGLVYIGAFIVHPRIFASAPPGKFSMNVLWDRAIAQGRLHGLEHAGWWLHVGTPEAIVRAEHHMRSWRG